MKKLLFVLSLNGLFSLSAIAQVFVDGVNINEQEIVYCQLIGFNRASLNPTRIWLDYGQENFMTGLFKSPPAITGPDRKRREFNTVIDALNFMSTNGWELVSMQIAPGSEGGIGTYVYLLRKRAP